MLFVSTSIAPFRPAARPQLLPDHAHLAARVGLCGGVHRADAGPGLDDRLLPEGLGRRQDESDHRQTRAAQAPHVAVQGKGDAVGRPHEPGGAARRCSPRGGRGAALAPRQGELRSVRRESANPPGVSQLRQLGIDRLPRAVHAAERPVRRQAVPRVERDLLGERDWSADSKGCDGMRMGATCGTVSPSPSIRPTRPRSACPASAWNWTQKSNVASPCARWSRTRPPDRYRSGGAASRSAAARSAAARISLRARTEEVRSRAPVRDVQMARRVSSAASAMRSAFGCDEVHRPPKPASLVGLEQLEERARCSPSSPGGCSARSPERSTPASGFARRRRSPMVMPRRSRSLSTG